MWEILEGSGEGKNSEQVKASTGTSEDPARTRDQLFAVFPALPGVGGFHL